MIGPIEDLQQFEAADRRGAIALALGAAGAGAPKRAREDEIASLQSSPPVVERGTKDANEIDASALHRQWKGYACPLLSSWE
jgi:hypothetical protein